MLAFNEYNKAHKNWIKHQRLIRKALRHYKQDLRFIRNALKHQKTSQELHMGYIACGDLGQQEDTAKLVCPHTMKQHIGAWARKNCEPNVDIYTELRNIV